MNKKEDEKEPVHVFLDKELLNRIEDYRRSFTPRMPTRATAMRSLLDYALTAFERKAKKK